MRIHLLPLPSSNIHLLSLPSDSSSGSALLVAFEPLQQHTADSESDARFSLACKQYLHCNSHSDLATLHPNHLGEPDTPTQCAFLKFEFLRPHC